MYYLFIYSFIRNCIGMESYLFTFIESSLVVSETGTKYNQTKNEGGARKGSDGGGIEEEANVHS